MTLIDLINKPNKTIPEKEFIEYYKKLMPVGDNPCTINRIAWLFEDTFKTYLSNYIKTKEFDYSILKSGVEYSKNDSQSFA